MNTKYTYEIRPNKPFNFMDKTIKSNCSLQLNLAEAKTILESGKARVYRIFPDINNSVKVDKGNIEELHRSYYNSKPIINRAGTIKEGIIENRKGVVINESDQLIPTVNEKKVEKAIIDNEDSNEDDSKVGEENSEDDSISEGEKAEDATIFMSESEVKEVLEHNEQTEEALVEHKVVPTVESEDSFDGIEKNYLNTPKPVEEKKEDISDTELEEAEKAIEETSEVADEEKKEESEDNKNRFYNTQIMTNGSGKKKHNKK